jgi:two-component system, OmpR family, KDP operon response regulator KdpE
VDGAGLQSTIAGGGYETRLARTVDDVVREAESGWPDLVLLHTSVGDPSVPDRITHLRSHVTQPLIVMSASRDAGVVTAMLDAGADDHIGDPIGSAELLARMRAHLRRITRP